MDNQEATNKTQKMADAYRRILQSNKASYNRRYHSDMEFRNREIERNSQLIMRKYNSDPEYRQRCLDAAKARYHAKKLMASRDKVE